MYDLQHDVQLYFSYVQDRIMAMSNYHIIVVVLFRAEVWINEHPFVE